MKDKIDELAKKLGLSRREFMKKTAQSGAILGAAPFLGACSNNSDRDDSKRESRIYHFDLSHTDEGDEHYLIAGANSHKLNKIDANIIAQSGNPLLQAIPEGLVTHHITADFPSDSIQSCYIRTIKPDDPVGVWGMSLSFFHLPTASVRRAVFGGKGTLASSAKLSYYGIDSSVTDAIDIYEAYLHEDAIKSFIDQAVDLAFHHPEVLSMESDSATHIQKNIIAVQPATYELAIELQQQGSATESGGWATLEPYINKDTGAPYLNSQGMIQYFPRYSDTTNTYLGNAINPSLESVKNDVTLGVNITDLDPTVENPELNGKIWNINNGITTVETDQLLQSDGFLTCPNKSRRHGYKATFISEDSGTVTFKVENWFLRYLGIYVQFLDSNGDKIKLSDLPSNTLDSFPKGSSVWDSDYIKFADMLSPELAVLGIPVKHETKEISFVWPTMASSAVIIAGGIGNNDSDYDHTTGPGIAATVLVDLAVPVAFLGVGATSTYGAFLLDVRSMTFVQMETLIVDLIVELSVDLAAWLIGSDPTVFIEIGKTVGEFILAKGVEYPFVKLMEKNLEEGEVLDSIPLIGKILATMGALGLVAEIAETLAETLNSPSNYAEKLTATHDINVTVYPDKNDPNFPADATHYILTAMFDNGTPISSGRIDMSGTVSGSITYTFSKGMPTPYGGNVKVCIGFYADNGWLAGKGCSDNITNDTNSENIEITITEFKVPISATTQYLHKQKIALDDSGNHIWDVTSTAPTQKADSLNCESTDGNLCQLNGITVSEHTGTLGYDWKSYSSEITSCESSGVGQLHQFSTASFTQDPQDSYLAPICGFSAPPRIIFDLMSSKNNNYYLDTTEGKNHVRQVRLTLDGKPSIDEPDSNLSWGKFNLPSDALLLHPSRKLISINTALNKIEILELPDAATTDAETPIAVSYSGRGTRHGLLRGPVAAAISPQGVILVLESKNMRVQAFDTGINPVPYFENGAFNFPLKEETETVYYVDMAMEYTGYIYILSYTASFEYRLDIYDKDGKFITRTIGVNAAKMTVDLWRNVFSLNYEVLKMPDGTQPTITEPSVSQWIPTPPDPEGTGV